MLLDQVGYYARRYCGLDESKPVLVGISGGPDSFCLLDILHRLGYHVVAAHFNHMLRAEADLEAEHVRSYCLAEKIPIVLDSQPVADFARKARLSLEDAARSMRYRFLFTQARQLGAQAVAVGHNADDQVETVLLHLLQGSGLTGLRGMSARSINLAWDAHIPLVRPLLEISHDETMAYCQERDLQPVQDLTNLDRRYLRNRLRHEVIPVLEASSPLFKEAVLRLASLAQADDEFLENEAGRALDRCLLSSGRQYIILNRSPFIGLPLAIRRRVLRLVLATLAADRREIGWGVIERALAFIEKPRHSHAVDLSDFLCLRIEQDAMILSTWDADLPSDAYPQMKTGAQAILPVPGQIDMGSGWYLEASWVEQDFEGIREQALNNNDPYQAWLDGSTLEPPLEARTQRRGDRFQPLGLAGQTQKLSDFFVNARLPVRIRTAWPLLCSSNRIVWIPGFRQAHETRLIDQTVSILYLRCAKH